MTILTQGQIQALAVTAGLPDPSLMAAIAMAESSGDTAVVNSIGCVGLWQINQPVHVKDHPNWTVAYLKNPLNNALAAKTTLAAQGLGAWEAYTNGAYLKYYNKQAAASPDAPQGIGSDITGIYGKAADSVGNLLGDAANATGLGGISDAASGAVSAAETVTNYLGALGQWISKASNWVRVGYVIGGAILVAVGLYATAGEETMNFGKKVADSPAGKAAMMLAK